MSEKKRKLPEEDHHPEVCYLVELQRQKLAKEMRLDEAFGMFVDDIRVYEAIIKDNEFWKKATKEGVYLYTFNEAGEDFPDRVNEVLQSISYQLLHVVNCGWITEEKWHQIVDKYDAAFSPELRAIAKRKSQLQMREINKTLAQTMEGGSDGSRRKENGTAYAGGA